MRLSKASLSLRMLPLVFLIGACGKSGALGDQPQLSGQFDGWSKGSDYTFQVVAATAPTASPLASAPIDASGNFSITLPGRDVLAPYLVEQHTGTNGMVFPGCTDYDLKIDPADFASAPVSFRAVSGTTKLNIVQTVADPPITIYYVYIDRDLSETGSLNCTVGSTTINETVDTHFSPGWNTELLQMKDGVTQVTTEHPPANAKWTVR